MPSSYAQKDLPKLIALVALYVLAARLTLLLFGNNGVVEFLWAASGISLAVVLLGGNKYLPAVFLGSLPGYLLIGEPPGFSVAVALCHAASIFLGTWVMKREGGLNPALLKPGASSACLRSLISVRAMRIAVPAPVAGILPGTTFC